MRAFDGLLRIFGRHETAAAPKRRGYLHIGSRIPLEDLEKAKSGNHALVDPYFASLAPSDLKKLKRAYPSFELSPKPAHEFLEGKIAEGVSYTTIRIDSPYTGIIDESSDFGLLCRQMKAALSPHGHIIIVTDYKPDKTGAVHKFSEDDAVFMNSLLGGREINELSVKEAEILKKSVKEEKTANIIKELKRAGFRVKYFEAPLSAIRKSETALKRAASGKKVYMVVATNH